MIKNLEELNKTGLIWVRTSKFIIFSRKNKHENNSNIFILFSLGSCSKPASKWSKSKYKFMVWEFAGALERNYNKWDTNQSLIKWKSYSKIFTKTKNRSKQPYDYYHKNNNNGAQYDENTMRVMSFKIIQTLTNELLFYFNFFIVGSANIALMLAPEKSSV